MIFIFVIGIGRHRIRLVLDYDVYCYYWDEDKPDYNRIVHYNNTVDYYKDIWTFRFIGTPHMHPREKFEIARCFDVMRNGSFSGRLYIDGELVWNDKIYMEH